MPDYGQQMVETAIRKDLIRKIIYHNANLISVGVKVIPTVLLDTLAVKFDYPGEMNAVYPVGDTAVAPRETIGWSEFSVDLQKAQVHYMITDAAKLRSLAGTQNAIMAQRSSEALAKKKDDDILSVVHGGAGDSVAASGVWANQSTDIESDVVAALNKILVESNINDMELQRGVTMVVPVKAFQRINQLMLIGNVQQTLKQYLKDAHGISIWPTRSTQLGSSASVDSLMFVPGSLTGQHGVLSPAAAARANVPLTERERVLGSGWDYLITQWFKTVVIEDGSAAGQTDRIVKITNVTT